mmetsp:Transcript_17682/g.50087  ORF Transcript_17682/g.50087 Transcript_17682/m.50087 type:complete len:209 (-) Transcript_17682:1085-1711(-)
MAAARQVLQDPRRAPVRQHHHADVLQPDQDHQLHPPAVHVRFHEGAGRGRQGCVLPPVVRARRQGPVHVDPAQARQAVVPSPHRPGAVRRKEGGHGRSCGCRGGPQKGLEKEKNGCRVIICGRNHPCWKEETHRFRNKETGGAKRIRNREEEAGSVTAKGSSTRRYHQQEKGRSRRCRRGGGCAVDFSVVCRFILLLIWQFRIPCLAR